MKENERKAIVKHIQHRAHIGKKSKSIRVRGHKQSKEKVSRWEKETMGLLYSPTRPPSSKIILLSYGHSLLTITKALPDCVSINTRSTHSRNIIVSDHRIDVQPTAEPGASSDVLGRLARHAHISEVRIDRRETRFLLNDLQTILTSPYCSGGCSTPSTAPYEEDIVQLRNLINLTQNIDVNHYSKGLYFSVHLGKS